jgi:type 1 glutamine amidotransferase
MNIRHGPASNSQPVMQSNLCTIFMLWFALVTGASAAESLDQGASANPRETSAAKGQAHRILVYTRNGPTLDGKPGYVHDNIASSVAAIRQLGKENGFDVDVSDDPGAFTGENLKKYKVLVFSNTNNESIETEDQKAAFQRFIRAGGGFVGIHSACGSMRNWPWFWSMIGGTFDRHPRLQPFAIKVVDRGHPSTSFLGETWAWEDEFYYLKSMPAGLHILLAGDLSTLDDPAKPQNKTTQPLAWYHEFEGGRCWFTALGHKKEHYADSNFRKHLLGGIRWAMADKEPNTR